MARFDITLKINKKTNKKKQYSIKVTGFVAFNPFKIIDQMSMKFIVG